ncbi:hypothetical protein C8F01DRAFT_953354, partial [Mycena amicta]
PRKLSHDLTARIPILFHEQALKVEHICELLGVKKSTVYTSLSNYVQYGVAQNPEARKAGRHRVLTFSDVNYMKRHLSHRGSTYLDEMQKALDNVRDTDVSISTISRTIHRSRISRKQVSAPALERNELLRADFMNRIGRDVPDPNCLMFIDEAARNNRTSARRMGYSAIGKRCISRR